MTPMTATATIERRTTAGRPRLTPHQRNLLRSLVRRSGLGRQWVDERSIGARMALVHLYEKGYAERRQVVGPRGGVTYEYRPVSS